MYGVLGRGSAPRSVIEASLNDIGSGEEFLIPWYGEVSAGIETVYDWLLDNNVKFTLVTPIDGKQPPRVLRNTALAVEVADDVDARIIDTLSSDKGIALILWNEDDEEVSVATASRSIDSGLPTLELTNGMVPIIFDDTPAPEEAPAPSAPEEDTEDMSFDLATLENMPAAVVKRMAKEKGFDAKTRGDAIAFLSGEPITDRQPSDKTIVSVVITFSDGSQVRY